LKKSIAASIVVTPDLPPYYLRGDLDGDGRADYAVAVRGRKTKRRGVLICDAKDRVFILGADSPTAPPFSDVEGDEFFAPNWAMLSRPEAETLSKEFGGVPHPFPKLLGEAIAMTWENGVALIYWDGNRYRWAGFK
jgi:hypothetical protein